MTDTERTILDTPYWKMLLRTDDQEYLGRAVLVCKRTVPSIADLSKEEWQDLHDVMSCYERACIHGFGASVVNWSCLMNLSYQHQPPDPQVHWHIRPRYAKPVTIAGEIFTDKQFGHHYERKTERAVSDDAAKEIITTLKKYL